MTDLTPEQIAALQASRGNRAARNTAMAEGSLDNSGGWEGDGSVEDQNLMKVMEIVGVDSATGVNANDFTKYGLTREQIQEIEFVKTDINRLMANVTMKTYDSEVEYLDDLGTLQKYFQKFVVGDGNAFTPGMYDKEMRDASERFKIISKFWLSPDASGNIANPYEIMEKWARSMHDQRVTKGAMSDNREPRLSSEDRSKRIKMYESGSLDSNTEY